MQGEAREVGGGAEIGPRAGGSWWGIARWIVAAAGGVPLALPLPPWDMEWVSWICLAPLLAALWAGRRRPGVWVRFGLGYVAGATFFLLTLSWLREVTVPGWFLLCLYLAIYPGFWGILAGGVGWVGRGEDAAGAAGSPFLRSGHNLWVATVCAAGWVSVEWLRGVVFSGFGWNGLGVSLHANVALIQMVEWTGVAGLTFLLVLVNVVFFLTVWRLGLEARRRRLRPHLDFTITAALVLGAFVGGVRMLGERSGSGVGLRVAIVQANVPRRMTWELGEEYEMAILERYRRLSGAALATAPDLLVWPEAATPRPVLHDPFNWDVARQVMESGSFWFLLGTLDQEVAPGERDMRNYNASLLFSPGGETMQMYRKLRLVPFGEFLPLRGRFFLFDAVAGPQVPCDFSAGTEVAVLEMERPRLGIGPLICFEDTLGDLARGFVLRGADLLVNVTNDVWFGRSAGSAQHLANAVFRAVENRRPLVRAANTGVSCMIDAGGRITHRLTDGSGETFIEGVLVGRVEVRPGERLTFYSCYGEIFAFGCLTLATLVSAIGVARGIGRRRRRKG